MIFGENSLQNRDTEAKRNFAPHCDFSVDINDLERHLKPRSEIRLTLLEILCKMSIKSLFKTVKLTNSPSE